MRAASKRLSQATTLVQINLRGTEYHLHPLRLRLSDPAGFTANRQRLFEISEVVNKPESFQIIDTSFRADEGLNVKWGDGRASFFPKDWLEAHFCNTRQHAAATSPAGRDEPYLWNAQFRTFLPELNYEEFSLEAGKERLVSYLTRYGIVLLRNVPCEHGKVEAVGNEIGYVRTTNYGSIFDVVDLGSQGNNLAQTNCRILAHTDNPYRDPFPGVQMLHCLASAADGGATAFTDGFAAANALRRSDPAAFELLTRYRHPFEYRDATQGVCLRAAAPVLSLSPEGRVERVCFNNRSAGVLDLPPEELERYYRAWARFDEICNAEERVLKVQLRPGDLAIWLNYRVMHGREEYTPGAGRHLQGCYIDHDSVHSRADARREARGDLAAERQGVLFDVHEAVTDIVLAALATQEGFCYGEGLNMLQHALQAADMARRKGEGPSAILASLMHDVGNSPQARQFWEAAGRGCPELLVSPSDSSIGYRHHADIGAAFLQSVGFAPEVVGAVRAHVSAKRALVAMDPAYMDELSQASIDTLAQQGGPLSEAELRAFQAAPGADVALRLRRYDDQGKDSNAQVPQLDTYRRLIYDHLRLQSSGST